MKIVFLTIFALCCFALNSLLCRFALGANEIDAASFTTIRIVSGAIVLCLLALIFRAKNSNAAENDLRPTRENWISAFFLFAYAICFSLAYLKLTAATGALVLFGTVQATMLVAALFSGERPRTLEIAGWLAAFGGLIYLISPGIAAPPAAGSVLMMLAGIAWGIYTLRGRGAANPLTATTKNFVCAVLPALLVLPFAFYRETKISTSGVALAVASGAIASGVGYTVWYAALKHHTATRAAILQLAVPLLTALGGVLFLSEIVSLRLAVAGALILGGIWLAIFGRKF